MDNRFTKVLKKLGISYKEFGDDVIEITYIAYTSKKLVKVESYHVVDEELELINYQLIINNEIKESACLTYEMAIQKVLAQTYEEY